jgi:hypothetical protein
MIDDSFARGHQVDTQTRNERDWAAQASVAATGRPDDAVLVT